MNIFVSFVLPSGQSLMLKIISSLLFWISKKEEKKFELWQNWWNVKQNKIYITNIFQQLLFNYCSIKTMDSLKQVLTIYNIIKLFLIAGYKNACIVFLFYRSVSHVCPNILHTAFNETSNTLFETFYWYIH